MLDILKLDSDVTQEVEKDTLGGGGALDTDLYGLTLKTAYYDYAKSKAMSLNLMMETSSGRRLKITEYITSGETKGCKPYYEKDGKKFPLPGYSKMNTLCLLVTGKPIVQLAAEDKILKLYDFTERKEINQTKKVIVDLTGVEIKAGVFKIIEDKKTKVGDEYVATGETREINEIGKFFNTEGKTLEEVTEGKEATFAAEWSTAHKGKTKDKSTKSPGGTAAGAPQLGNVGNTPALSFT